MDRRPAAHTILVVGSLLGVALALLLRAPEPDGARVLGIGVGFVLALVAWQWLDRPPD